MKLIHVTLLLCLLQQVAGFVAPSLGSNVAASNSLSSTSALNMIGTLFPTLQKSQQTSNENGLDKDYPWCFTGRLWFRPALVKVQDSNTQGLDRIISVLNLFGYTLGGTVALEYDTSPVGPHHPGRSRAQ